jgi:zinc transport system permease protein
VIALLTVPAAVARQWSESLVRMMALATAVGAVCTAGGLFLSYGLSDRLGINVPTGPLIIVLAVAIYGASSLLRAVVHRG